MTKNEYLNQLKNELQGFDEKEVSEIIRDQNEHIDEALRSGRSEADVIQSLGAVKDLANELKAGLKIKSAQNEDKLFPKTDKLLRAIFGLALLAPFNFIFVMGPFIGICSGLVGLWSIAGSGFFIGLLGAGLSFLTLPIGLALFVACLFGSIAVVGLSILFLVGCYKLSFWFIQLMIRYLKWNVEFVIGEKI